MPDTAPNELKKSSHKFYTRIESGRKINRFLITKRYVAVYVMRNAFEKLNVNLKDRIEYMYIIYSPRFNVHFK